MWTLVGRFRQRQAIRDRELEEAKKEKVGEGESRGRHAWVGVRERAGRGMCACGLESWRRQQNNVGKVEAPSIDAAQSPVYHASSTHRRIPLMLVKTDCGCNDHSLLYHSLLYP